jgi:hypothetical protein
MTEADPNGVPANQPGAKLDLGKAEASLLEDFGLALLEVAKVGTFGAKKYSRGGWQQVPESVYRYGNALWRHLLRRRYEEIDPDSGLAHDAHLAWNALSRLEIRIREQRGVK